jgi:DNA-binding phage protein
MTTENDGGCDRLFTSERIAFGDEMLETLPWDAAEMLKTEEDIAAYLEAILEEGDLELLIAALNDVVRAKALMIAT